jgi:hypothetical protein
MAGISWVDYETLNNANKKKIITDTYFRLLHQSIIF